jgi:tetratricopeptide (TPR) repeat protein
MTGWRFALPLLAGVVLITAGPAVADMVKLENGTWLVERPSGDRPTQEELENSRVTVVSEQYDALTYRIRGLRAPQTLPAAEVARVYYAENDASYLRAARLMLESDLAGALTALDRAVTSKVRWVPQYAMWDRVRIRGRLAQPRKAVEAIEVLIEKVPKSKFLIVALRTSGRIHIERLGEPRKAARQFRRILSLRGISENTRAEVGYWLVYVDEVRARTGTEIGAVKARYRKILVTAGGKHPDVAAKARLGIGRCLIALERNAEALAFFKAIVSGSDGADEEILAGAYVGIGDANFRMEKWLAARRAYLRVAILWEEFPEHHAKALCRAGNCFLLAREGNFGARARRELGDCLRLHPGTSWAEKARDLVTRVPRRSSRRPR